MPSAIRMVERTPSSNVVVGLKSECKWEVMGKKDIVLVVNHIKNGNLTWDRIEQDFEDLLGQPFFDDIEQGCPRMVILTYLVDHQVDSEAIRRLVAPPEKEYCQVKFVAAQNGVGKSYFFEGELHWGKAFSPELRYYAGHMTGDPAAMQQLQPPPRPFELVLK